MEALVKQKGTVRLRKIDIGDWDSDVAKEHGINRLPSLALYDGTELVSSDTRRVLELMSKP